MGCCSKCGKWCGVSLLVFALVFLLGDLGVWGFWGISWWTVAFALAGLGYFGCSKCDMCQKKK